MVKYKVTYFGVKGRVQATRYLLEDNRIDYEYVAVSFDDWPTMKPNMPFGQLPCLDDGDLKLVQSHAIIRHLARKHGMYGADGNEAARIDMVYEGAYELFEKFAKMLYSGEKYNEEKVKYFEGLPEFLTRLEALLSQNGGGKGFFVGQKISFADYAMFDSLQIHDLHTPGCLDKFALLKSYVTRMGEREKIKSFMNRDDIKKMPVTVSGNL